jgi:uncharacterized membrane protein YccF (DUF307 family)
MNLLLNILWGIALCLTIVGIPFGLQCFKLALFALAPFGAQAIDTTGANGCFPVLFNIFWILMGGLWISITHLILALIYAITIIGIPFAVQHVKMAGLAIAPFGKRIE